MPMAGEMAKRRAKGSPLSGVKGRSVRPIMGTQLRGVCWPASSCAMHPGGVWTAASRLSPMSMLLVQVWGIYVRLGSSSFGLWDSQILGSKA